MRKSSNLLAGILMTGLLLTACVQKIYAQDVSVSYQTFYDELSPYGQWVSDPDYGNVWVPDVPQGFRPYATDGHWEMTDYGNMWISDEPWAWAAYHYGRWTYNEYYGWIWVPGRKWAPAWVSWRYGRGYYGWAPLGPHQSYGGDYEYPDNYWVFVNPDYLYHPNVYNYYERGNMGIYLHRTSYVRYEDRGDHYYGPRREEIERYTHRPVEVYHVSEAHEVGGQRIGGHEVSIYRPVIGKDNGHESRPFHVIEGGSHPIGTRPQPIAADHGNRSPAFHQEHEHQGQPQQPGGQPGGRPQQQYGGRPQEQQQGRPQEQQGRPQQQWGHPDQGRPTQQQSQQEQGRPQHQEQGRPMQQQPPQQQGRPQQQEQGRPMQQQQQQPQGRPQQWGQQQGRPQQQPQQQQGRPQQQPQPQQQGRPQQQPQPQQQQGRPQQQPQQQHNQSGERPKRN